MNGHRRDRLLDLALVLSGVAMMAGLVTLLVPDLLTGPAVMNGSARGTALVLVLGAVPSLVVGVAEARRGAVRGLAVATGATAYLVYNAVLFAFATPFNRAFLVYEATLGLAIFSLVGLGARLWRSTPSLSTPPPRWVAVFLWTIAGLNVLAWLSTIVPALFSNDPRSILEGTGLATSPVYVQDLAFWLPAIVWVALGVWRRHPPRVALASAALWFWLLEAIGVAVDQWWGHHADPSSTVASAAAVPLFGCVAVITAWPLLRLLRCLPPTARGSEGPLPRGPIDAQSLGVGSRS